jgi:hypothetical protein
VFSLGTLPGDAKGRGRAEDLAARLNAVLDGARMAYAEAGRALGVHHNSLRYAAATGTVLIRWDGARQATVMTVQPWRRLSRAERDAVVAEAESLPLSTPQGRITVRWDD